MSKRRSHVTQKGKDGKRPRRFHRGRAQGVINDRLMRETLEPAYDAAAADREAIVQVSATHRREVADWQDCIAQLERIAPFVSAAFPSALG